MRLSLPRLLSPLLLSMMVLTGCALREQVAALPLPMPAPAQDDWIPPPEPPPLTAEQLAFRAAEAECLAQAIYFEARGEGYEGRRAVGHVVLNRVAQPGFPDTVCEVVRQGGETPPCQFSWWCDGKSDEPTEPQAWADSVTLAYRMLDGLYADPTAGALFFHHTAVRPRWRRAFEETARIGPHIFYRLPEVESGGGE